MSGFTPYSMVVRGFTQARQTILNITDLVDGEAVPGATTQQVVIEGINGTPEGNSVGSPGDLRVRKDVPQLWQKITGERSVNGWSQISGGTGLLTFEDLNASRAIADSDLGALVLANSAAPIVVSLGDTPSSGFYCEVARMGTGSVTFSASGAVPIRSAGGLLAISDRYAGVTVTRLPTEWLVVGGLS